MIYKHLFSPIKIKNMQLKNRLVMPAINLVYAEDGYVNDRLKKFYVKRAEGGVGLITIGGCPVDDNGSSFAMIKLSDDRYIDKLRELTDEIHKTDTKIGAQLFHNGRYARSQVTGRDVLAPSAVYSKYSGETPKAMTLEDIERTIEHFGSAAARARKSGFDMVEIIASAGYLICQFLSPLTNQREDEYGGCFENRCRFPVEIVKAVRAAVGENFPIFMRISGNDFMEGGQIGKDAVSFSTLMEEVGIDALNVTGGWHETGVPQITGDLPQGGFTYLAAEIKDKVSIPVFISNRINDPAHAELILSLGMADGINMARPLICDPFLPQKAENGKPELIRRCIACEQSCMDHSFKGKPLGCAINPWAGQEGKEQHHVDEGKKIVVVGGGPGGAQAALSLAEYGHEVILFEKNDSLGGQFNLAAATSGKNEFHKFVDYLKQNLAESTVDVRLNTLATPKSVLAESPDAVVIATGAIARGIDLPNEGFEGDVVQANDILSGKVFAGKQVVVIGGGAVGCETALYCAEEGTITPEQTKFLLFHQAEQTEKIDELVRKSRRQVTIVEVLGKIGKDIGPGTRWVVMKEIRQYGINKFTQAKIEALTPKGVRIRENDGVVREIPADTVITAVGSIPDNGLYEALSGKIDHLYLIGDAQKPRKVTEAVQEATKLAIEIFKDKGERN